MSDRHEKWTRVEPGAIISAGHPIRVEREEPTYEYAVEFARTQTRTAEDFNGTVFIDSSWKPPLVLPTEPTWGISIRCNGVMIVDQAHRDGSKNWQISGMLSIPVSEVIDFIPLTDEQVARIEVAR